jgi:hypothetical protein
LGPQTADLHYTAARLYAVAARNDGVHRDDYVKKVYGHLANALGHGLSPKSIQKQQDVAFLVVKHQKAFQDLLNRPVPPTSAPMAPQLVDPVPDGAR